MSRSRRAMNPIAGRERVSLAVVLALGGLLLFSFSGLVLSSYSLNQQADSLRREIEVLKAENERLQRELAYWESDEGLERLAREQLGWVKPGETAVITVPMKTRDEVNGKAPVPRRTELPNWQRWWNLFFGE